MHVLQNNQANTDARRHHDRKKEKTTITCLGSPRFSVPEQICNGAANAVRDVEKRSKSGEKQGGNSAEAHKCNQHTEISNYKEIRDSSIFGK